MKVCPLRMQALESDRCAVQNTGNADQIMSDVNSTVSDPEGLLRETIGCLGKDCSWYDEGECAVTNIALALDAVWKHLG